MTIADHLVDQIYAAVGRPELLPDVLEAAAKALDVQAARLDKQELALEPQAARGASLSIPIADNDLHFVVERARGSRVTVAQRHLASEIAEHLAVVIELNAVLEDTEGSIASLATVLERAGISVMAIDQDGNVLSRPPASVVTASPFWLGFVEVESLQRAFHTACSTGEDCATRATTVTGRNVALHFVIPPKVSGPALAAVRMLVAVTPLHHSARDTARPLGAIFGLSASEGRLAALVGGGTRVSEAATSLGISLQTARFVLQRVFAKTGHHRQAELTDTVMRLGLVEGRPLQ